VTLNSATCIRIGRNYRQVSKADLQQNQVFSEDIVPGGYPTPPALAPRFWALPKVIRLSGGSIAVK
ncbi:MAG: hypothetical protein ACREWG_16185, partial [Gammaproteobacteria bacterium]